MSLLVYVGGPVQLGMYEMALIYRMRAVCLVQFQSSHVSFDRC